MQDTMNREQKRSRLIELLDEVIDLLCDCELIGNIHDNPELITGKQVTT